MQSDNKDFSHSENTFGTGFVLGAAFAGIAFFFLTTKSGKELITKLSEGNWDAEKLSEFLHEKLKSATNNAGLEPLKKENLQEEVTPSSDTKEAPISMTTSILGRRFFHRKK